MKANKGKFLSALIIINGLAITIASILLAVDQDVRNFLGQLPEWFTAYVLILLLARLVALYAIWYLRKWAVFALLLLECVEVALGLFVFTDFLTLTSRALIAVPSFMILLVIWFLALRPNWQLFR